MHVVHFGIFPDVIKSEKIGKKKKPNKNDINHKIYQHRKNE